MKNIWIKILKMPFIKMHSKVLYVIIMLWVNSVLRYVRPEVFHDVSLMYDKCSSGICLMYEPLGVFIHRVEQSSPNVNKLAQGSTLIFLEPVSNWTRRWEHLLLCQPEFAACFWGTWWYHTLCGMRFYVGLASRAFLTCRGARFKTDLSFWQ